MAKVRPSHEPRRTIPSFRDHWGTSSVLLCSLLVAACGERSASGGSTSVPDPNANSSTAGSNSDEHASEDVSATDAQADLESPSGTEGPPNDEGLASTGEGSDDGASSDADGAPADSDSPAPTAPAPASAPAEDVDGPASNGDPQTTASNASVGDTIEPPPTFDELLALPRDAAAEAYPGPCRVFADTRGDRGVDEVSVYSYDDSGRVTSKRDFMAPGFGVLRETYNTYDAAGNELRAEVHYNEMTRRIVDRTFDDAGNVLTERVEDDQDDDIDSVTSFEYDTRGNQLSMRREADDGGVVELDSYDAQGRLARIEIDNRTEGDCTGAGACTSYPDGVADQVTEYTYEGEGMTRVIQLDSNADGSFETANRELYDAAGRLVEYQTYNSGSGVGTTLSSYSYDANGNLTSSTSSDASMYITYDQNGFPVAGMSTQSPTAGQGTPTPITESWRQSVDMYGNVLDYSIERTVLGSLSRYYDYSCWM